MIHALTEMPEGAAFALSLLLFFSYGILGLLFTRQILDRSGVARTQPAIAGWATCLAALTALLYTFVIANIWNNANLARGRVSAEGAAIRLLSRDLAPSSRPLLRSYALSVVTDEWPTLCDGDGSSKTAVALTTLEDAAKPVSDGARSDFYTQLGNIENLRDMRLQAARPSIPPEIWLSLLVLSGLLLAVTFFGHLEHLGFHIGLTLLLAGALATLFWLTIQLDFPFCGGTVVGPDAIVAALRGIG